MENKSCFHCKFYYIDGVASDSTSECRRYAPRPRANQETDARFEPFWPNVSADAWCGEFEERKERASK